jgi:SsrA-binding protein
MSIAQNKKAFFDYFIEDKYEAGIVLEGWEVKAIRDNRVNIKEAYVIIQRGEIYLIGCHVTPLGAASTHIRPDAIRTRKLLLHSEEISKFASKCRLGLLRARNNMISVILKKRVIGSVKKAELCERIINNSVDCFKSV